MLIGRGTGSLTKSPAGDEQARKKGAGDRASINVESNQVLHSVQSNWPQSKRAAIESKIIRFSLTVL